MTDSVRQQIISALDTRLKAILVANGYQTNIGANVHDWLSETPSEDDLPILDYKDVSVSTEIGSFVDFTHEMSLIIRAAVKSGTPMVAIRQVIADVDKAIGVDHTFGQLALITKRIGDESGVQIGDQVFAGCGINLLITFRTLGWDDYTKV